MEFVKPFCAVLPEVEKPERKVILCDTVNYITYTALWFTSFCRVSVRARLGLGLGLGIDLVELGLQLGLKLRFVKLLTPFMCSDTDSVSRESTMDSHHFVHLSCLLPGNCCVSFSTDTEITF